MWSENSFKIIHQWVQREVKTALNYISIFTVRCESRIRIIPHSVQREVKTALELYLNRYSAMWKQD
jgi:hypothetical protein